MRDRQECSYECAEDPPGESNEKRRPERNIGCGQHIHDAAILPPPRHLDKNFRRLAERFGGAGLAPQGGSSLTGEGGHPPQLEGGVFTTDSPCGLEMAAVQGLGCDRLLGD